MASARHLYSDQTTGIRTGGRLPPWTRGRRLGQASASRCHQHGFHNVDGFAQVDRRRVGTEAKTGIEPLLIMRVKKDLGEPQFPGTRLDGPNHKGSDPLPARGRFNEDAGKPGGKQTFRGREPILIRQACCRHSVSIRGADQEDGEGSVMVDKLFPQARARHSWRPVRLVTSPFGPNPVRDIFQGIRHCTDIQDVDAGHTGTCHRLRRRIREDVSQRPPPMSWTSP